MKYLSELAKIVTKKKVQKIELFEEKQLRDGSSKYGDFFQSLANDRFKNDDEAAKYFYNSTSTDASYRKLKSRIKKRLFNHLFYLDTNQPSYSEYRKAYFTCNKNWTLMKILLVNNARNTFEKLGRQTINQAIKYEFTDLVVLCAKDLLFHYSLLGNQKKYNEYSDIINRNLKILEAEIHSEQLSQEIMIKFVTQTKITPKLKELARSNSQKAEALASRFKSYQLKYYNFYIGCLETQISNDYQRLINICNEAEKFYNSNKQFFQKEMLAMFSLFRITAYLQLRDYENGIIKAEHDLQYQDEGTYNWFNYLEYYFLLLMHVGDYTKAFELYDLAVNHPRYTYMNKIRQEKWKIFEAYLHFIYVNEKPVLPENISLNPAHFNLFKFLNEVPIFSKDKSGYNAAILIIQILMHLQRGEIDKIIDKTEALRVYSQRYLKNPEYFRAYTFIKMLLLSEKRSFDYIKTAKVSAPYLKQLRSKTHKNISEWEILPYEYLWEKIMEALDEI